ncbi:uncharacterized protein [Lolium perenne]|uniref:uncharacterized protein n=1 Tax=Lolium perenne TaxID=4522 RepID=UPI0021F5A31D|nr:uncharacterized protein LOC127348306 [Lolium perenne]
MATLRSALSRLAPGARFLSKGGRGSSGCNVTARRTMISGSGFKSPVFWDDHFNLKSPVTWFGIFSIAVAGTYRIKVMVDPEKRTRAKEEEEKAKRLRIQLPEVH